MKKLFMVIPLFLGALVITGFGREDAEINDMVKRMILERKIGQMIMVGIPGSRMNESARAIMEKYNPGGVILFGYNLAAGEGVRNFIRDMQRASIGYSGIPLFISVDQEGGRVRRLTDGITQFPGNMAFGVIDDRDLVYDAARVLGMELRIIGVNMNLAPVLDVNNNPDNPVINTRSFGSSPDVVARMGDGYIRGLQKSICMAVAKHFPGHGDTSKDSHVTLPVIPYDLERLNQIEFVPFNRGIGSGVSGVMTAHIAFPKILGNNLPATVSMKFLTGILRGDMGFKGLIITDDLEMDAVSKKMDVGEAAVRTIGAGSDIVLISTNGGSIPKIVSAVIKAVRDGTISEERINASVRNIIGMKIRFRIMKSAGGGFLPDGVEYGPEEKKSLRAAVELNRRASRESIYYYDPGRKDFPDPGVPGTRFLLITGNRILREEVRERNSGRIVLMGGEEEYFKSAGKNLYDPKRGRLWVFYHLEYPRPQSLKKIIRAAEKAGHHLVVLSTGNPFLISRFEPLPSTLFTFSNTDESLRQAAACLHGDFSPRKEVNLALGIRRSAP